ncbi:hypothetical protein CISIN_1g035381mg [Citrus sinensis]|uniref:Uncharacterized protein n=1 Tax=Citrus sinensis TaxID=2711 RepID=A0A067DU34_CITSI|nr:hypothetical protein CISIN_1g035381mg [Citrus sinensis]
MRPTYYQSEQKNRQKQIIKRVQPSKLLPYIILFQIILSTIATVEFAKSERKRESRREKDETLTQSD